MFASTLNSYKTLGESADSCKYFNELFASFTHLFVQNCLGFSSTENLSSQFSKHQLFYEKCSIAKDSKRSDDFKKHYSLKYYYDFKSIYYFKKYKEKCLTTEKRFFRNRYTKLQENHNINTV